MGCARRGEHVDTPAPMCNPPGDRAVNNPSRSVCFPTGDQPVVTGSRPHASISVLGDENTLANPYFKCDSLLKHVSGGQNCHLGSCDI